MSNKTIAKNTFFLYFRMLLVMGVSLYTSRIILQQLGISDFGIYTLVGGIVAMFSFFNSAMSSATQRYLSYYIGKEDECKLKKTFSATLTIHFGIALLFFILAETLGLWYVNYKMVFPADKTYEVNVVYQFSILTFLLNIIQVPYNALIIARERMKIYAYMSVLEALLKLSTVFYLMWLSTNKLISYAILLFVVSFIIRIFYQIYCRREFQESKYIFFYDKCFFIELVSYSGWNLFGNIAAVAKGQGVNIVLNLFYGTVVNAAYGISNQLVSAVNMFVVNLQMAFNPRIIINYSQGNIKQTEYLIFQGSKISFVLLLLLVMPILLNTEYILKLWLTEVPPNTRLFVQLALIGVLVESLSGTLMTGAQATGKIKWYQIIIGTLIFLNLPISYMALRIGFEAYSVFVISVIVSIISLIFRLFFLKKIMHFNLKKYFTDVLLKVFITLILLLLYSFLYKKYYTHQTNFLSFLNDSLIVTLYLSVVIYVVIITKEEKKQILNILKKIKWSL